ncbi:MAG: heme lyase CcmF/NrfE family subunit [Chloroflexota bacterium]
MAEVGRIFIVLAFVVALYTTGVSVLGATRRDGDYLASARNGVLAMAALSTVAWFALLYAFVTFDFSLQYVAQYTSRETDLLYRISGSYAGQEGSLLLWAWTLAIFLVIVQIQNRRANQPLMPWVTAFMSFGMVFFLGLLTFFSDPFKRTAFVPADGQGLNPLLQNMGMFFHPTTLYIGYVGFSVPFAFALAALVTGRLGDEWIRSTRRWTLFAWFFLSLGNLFGAQWAYVELGWGGYWGWDPVESASFMPWLTGTAYLHSVMVQQRRGMLKVWNIALIVTTFALTIFGTFLTRSGVLASVHTFGDSGVGPAFIVFLAVLVVGSLGLLWARLPDLRSENELDSMLSRESSFLLNNLLLVGAAFAVFWGTVFPLISEAVRGVKVTVNAPFFNQVEGPILLALVILMGICPLIGWRRASTENLLRNFAYPLAVALVSAPVLYFLLGVRVIYAVVAFAACAFVLSTLLLEFYRGTRAKRQLTKRGYLACLLDLVWGNKPRYGGYVIHVGIILMAIGIAGSQAYKQEIEVTLDRGQDASVGGYRLVYEGLNSFPTQSKEVVAATVAVYSGDRLLGRMSPSKEFHKSHSNPNTEVAIRSTPLEDLYLILASWEQERASFKFVVNPLVMWIWIGGWVMLIGTAVAYWPDARERRRAEARQAVQRAAALAGVEG